MTEPAQNAAGLAPVWNRPGLPALAYRLGRHPQFLDAMLAALSGPGGDEALAGLTTREPDDPSMALLDAWAVVADVLTFYQERIADEGFLRTAQENESLVQLGRLVGHRPRPALAAAAHLAYTLDVGTSCVVPAGSQVRSEPEPGALPLTFETANALTARAEWNRLPVRTTRRGDLTADVAIRARSIDVEGVQHALRPGDRLLFAYADARLDLTRVVEAVRPDPEHGRTGLRLQVPDPPRQLAHAVDALREDLEDAARRAPSRGPFEDLLSLLREVRRHVDDLHDPDTVAARLDRGLRGLRERLSSVGDALDAGALAERASVRLATVQDAVRRLGEAPAVGVPRDTDALRRDLRRPGRTVLDAVDPLLTALSQGAPPPPTAPTVRDLLGAGSDALPRLLAGNRPGLTASLYEALSAVSMPGATAPDVLRFRVVCAPLGASVPDDARVRRLLRAAAPFRAQEDPLASDVLLLDGVHEEILPGGFVAVQVAGRPQTRVLRVLDAGQLSVAGGQDALRVTRLRLAGPWIDDCEDMAVRRAVTVWAAAEPLVPAASPDPEDVAGREIDLEGTFEGLAPGRLLVVSGKRTDVLPSAGACDGPGVPGCELAVLAGVRHGFDGSSPDGRVRTTLVLTAPLAHRYRRDSVVVHGNVVEATAGETVTEILGSGDASRAGQAFPLRQAPLVWLPSATAEGSEEALTVRVGDVAWRRTDDPGGEDGAAEVFHLLADRDGRATVRFGDGRHGARLPSGTENVTARYRFGGGRAGNVGAGRISQVVSRPRGVSGVTNPLPATGGADADGPAELREAIPLRLAALGRLVSVGDYEAFARAYAGVGKAVAARCADGGRPVLHVTVAAAGDVSLDAASPLVLSLRAALLRYGDFALPVRVEPCERVRLVLRLGVRTAPGHPPDLVERRVREALAARLGFAPARLAQPVYLSTVLAVAHTVPGVDLVDVDAFGGVPEGDEAAAAVRFAEDPSVAAWVPALPAGRRAARTGTAPAPAETVVLRPAQLVLLDPAVPETLTVRRIP
ncbi:putative baseplate assembly protein [Streptomyces sp. bgisy159]|uniref:putative baseplate assembly protein n=1 Tax=Streptomyces sp. bgisy159 TaxID=3413795 RepID=UPI003F4A27FF